MRGELAAIGVTNPWALVQTIRNFAKTVWDPTRSDIGHGINSLIAGALRDAPAEAVSRVEENHPGMAALYAERYDPDMDPRRLEGLPEGTLGKEYARFIRINGIDPLGTLLAIGQPQNALHFLFRRAYKLHDLMHVVLGCEATVLGEVRIVSWSLGQTPDGAGFASRAPAMALAVLFLHLALRKPSDVREAVRLAQAWLERGEQSRDHVTFRFEDYLDRPLDEVRGLYAVGASGSACELPARGSAVVAAGSAF